MFSTTSYPIEGGCDCKFIRYRMTTPPLIVNCCHCLWCQRESGGAFVLNAMIEADRVQITTGNSPLFVRTPTHSCPNPVEGNDGQLIARCPKCYVAVWSNYSGPNVTVVRVATFDDPNILPPDVHVFTESKTKWLTLPEDARVFPRFYQKQNVWSRESLERVEAVDRKMQLHNNDRRKNKTG